MCFLLCINWNLILQKISLYTILDLKMKNKYKKYFVWVCEFCTTNILKRKYKDKTDLMKQKHKLFNLLLEL